MSTNHQTELWRQLCRKEVMIGLKHIQDAKLKKRQPKIETAAVIRDPP
jgi:hypothetical protein